MSHEKRMTMSRKHHLKSVMLQIAAGWIEQEKKDIIEAKKAYMAEACPSPSLSGDQAGLMDTCRKLHALIDKVDEERYDLVTKIGKGDKEVHVVPPPIRSLMLQIAATWLEQEATDIAAAKEAYMAENCAQPDLSGDQAALMVTMDLRSNLKQVKKEVKEEPGEAVGDWRKNIEDKADRKKMFETS
ncbi:troponin I, fast skeletal muscle-like [Seriola lalandi dorsalis]|uniref:troponin I, fast skeletal muscle-like n=1 Tax=Seriola lalandi dorsalis TaxID=1841481 RepID=UPI000C6F5177|nr:troponin I, fast skeletal muscle-like [Seriola lalandi dorsalis]